MTYEVLFILAGYLSGSILFARVWAAALHKEGIIEQSPDKNPGATNALRYGGLLCGALTLVTDLAKGFLPVLLYCLFCPTHKLLPLMLAAPVIGHAFPLFYGFRGGKGLAVTFGCLLGLLPHWEPLIIHALMFILFSLVIRITPHYHRTLVTYVCSLLAMGCISDLRQIWLGFCMITVVVFFRMLTSKEEKGSPEVKLLWTR